MGRATQGVRLINIKGNDSIAAVTKVLREDEEIVDLDEEGNPIVTSESETSEEDATENDGTDIESDNTEE
jgi:DNA gyrase subunit A